MYRLCAPLGYSKIYTIQIFIDTYKLTTNCLTKQYSHFTNWMQRFSRLIEKHKMYTTTITTTTSNNNIIIIYGIHFWTYINLYVHCTLKRARQNNGNAMDTDRWFAVSSANADYNYIFIRSLFFLSSAVVSWLVLWFFANGKMVTSCLN